MENQYIPMNNEDRKVYYYERRSEYNNLKINIEENNIRKAALFIFLSELLTTNTLTSARATSVLTHLIKNKICYTILNNP